MFRKFARTIAAVALVAAATLPASLVAQAAATSNTKPETQVSVHVDNGNWLDMKVYAMRDGGVFHRIGTVTSFTSEEFDLPRRLISSNARIRIVAVPIGSTQQYSAPPLIVSNGDVIELKLNNNLRLSNVWIRTY